MSSVPRTASPHNPLRAQDLNRERVAVYCRVSSDEQAQAGTIQNRVGSSDASATYTTISRV